MNTRTDQVAQKLQLWRGQHQTPARIPEGIWNEAVALARELGVGPVARALKLDFASLKKRVTGAGARVVRSSTTTTTFVELLSGAEGLGACTLELQSVASGHIRLTMQNPGPGALAALLKGLGS